jgi:hypothetical protein
MSLLIIMFMIFAAFMFCIFPAFCGELFIVFFLKKNYSSFFIIRN